MECPKCKKDTLQYNRQWDEEYNRAFDKMHDTWDTPDTIRERLSSNGIFYAQCQDSSCAHLQMRHPGFESSQ